VTRVEELLAEIAEWARGEPDVRAALLLGSQARTEEPADEWSDVDVVLFVDDPARRIDDDAWVSRFGTPELTFVEATPVGGTRERRVLYGDGLEVDFAVVPPTAAGGLAADPEVVGAVQRGHRLLHDELGLAEAIAQLADAAPPPLRDPAEVVDDFWYHALWTARKHRRGEEITARACLESRLKPLLLELARTHALGDDPRADTWHGARFAERWADPAALRALWHATARSPHELPEALWRLCDAFDALAAETTEPRPGAAAARARLAELLPLA